MTKQSLVPPSVGTVKFSWRKSLWLWINLLPALVWAPSALTPSLAAVSLVLAFLTLCLGHSVGLHRGIIHRTYETSQGFRSLLVGFFVFSGLGGPLTWIRLHATRDYWQNREDCPRYFAYRHSMARDFIWNLHLGFEPADEPSGLRYPDGALQDPWLRFLERTWFLHLFGAAGLVGYFFSLDAVVVCISARIAASILGHWAIGYASHVWGESPHPIEGASEIGTNDWLLGVVSFGEGFHNNHHAFPNSARMGFHWYEFDLGYWSLSTFRKLGWVWNVQSREKSETVISPAFG